MSERSVNTDINFNQMNDRVKAEIRRTITALTFKLQRIIQEDMLTGQRLKVQSGRLRGSVSSKVEVSADTIVGTVGAGGTIVPYARVHEFGLKGALAIKSHLRMVSKVFGKPVTPRQVMIKAHTRNVNFPERRFMRDSLDQVAKIVPKNIDAAIERGLKGG